mgnify:CR=1 FL=1
MKLVDIKKISHDPRSKGYLVTLKSFEDSHSIDILVGTKDAKQISLAKEGINLPRPSTHDLLLNIVDSFDIKIKKIIITDYKSSTYYSKIVLYNTSMGEIQVDCRPSDGMIISLKSEVPIYISENLFNILSIDDTPGDKVSQNIQVESTSSLKKLNKELGEAIIAEEYEIAARLRDEISALSKKSIKK